MPGNETAKAPPPAWLNPVQLDARERLLEALGSGRIALEQRDRCLCGSAGAERVAEADRFGLPFGAHLCHACGLLFTSPFISASSVGLYYQEFYHILHFGAPASPGRALYSRGQGVKIFNQVRGRLRGGSLRVLEIGCGTGSVIKEFCRAAAEAGLSASGVGLEYSGEYARCADPEGLDIRVIEGGVGSLGPGDGPFDLVIMSHVLEHFPEPEAELAAIKGLISPGALLYVEVPGIFSLRYRYAYNCEFSRYLTGAHAFNFNLVSLASLMNRCGFELLWGTEEVEGVFTQGRQSTPAEGNAPLVREYLRELEQNHLFYFSLGTASLKKRLGVDRMEAELKQVAVFCEMVRTSLPYRVLKRFAGAFRALRIIK